MSALAGVGYNTSLESLRGSGYVREPLGHEAAGAALGHPQGEILGFHPLYHYIFQGGHVHAVDLVPGGY